jgi:predicted Zn-dependent protease
MTLLFSSNHALVLYHSRQYEEAIELARQLLASQPSLHQARSLLIRALVATGRVDEAMRELPLRTNEMPNVSDGALVYAHAGKRDKAQAEIKRMEKMSADGFGVGYELAVAHAALGELDAGCKSLELAWGDSSPFLGWMRLDPRMDPLRDQNCFAEILGRFDIQ